MDTTERHIREAATPGSMLGDPDLAGLTVGDCSCGESYTVPEGPGERELLDEAHARHVAGSTGKEA